MVLSNSQWFANPGEVYEIDQSCRFNAADSAGLTKTFGSAGNRRTWTLSWWTKRGNLGSRMQMFSVLADGGSQAVIEFDAGDGPITDQIIFNQESSGTTALNWELEWVFRDPAAWYHFVAAYDTTQSTTNDRFKFYVNGVEATEGWDRNSTPAQDDEQAVNNTLVHQFGKGHAGHIPYYDGYLAEVVFIDGTALDASSFGEFNSTTGQWIPKDVSGLTFGTNGFLLAFQDSSALGDDTSGNGNDFSSSGLAANDQVVDTPTDNYCT